MSADIYIYGLTCMIGSKSLYLTSVLLRIKGFAHSSYTCKTVTPGKVTLAHPSFLPFATQIQHRQERNSLKVCFSRPDF